MPLKYKSNLNDPPFYLTQGSSWDQIEQIQ